MVGSLYTSDLFLTQAQTQTVLIRSPSDRRLPSAILVPQLRPNHRPAAAYRLRVNSKDDVSAARALGLPLYLLEPWLVGALGYPLRFDPLLLVGRSVAGSVDTRLRRVEFHDDEAARAPRLEDVMVALLSIDPLGVRRLAVENRDRVDPVRLLRRILQQGVEARAYRVRLDEFAPGLPAIGRPLPGRELAGEDARPFARGWAL